MSFNDFVHKHNLKNKDTSTLKFNEVLKKRGLDSKVGIYMRDGPFSTDIGIVDLHPTKGTHWVCYISGIILIQTVAYVQKKLSMFIKKRNGYCLYSEYKKQGLTNKKYSYCASYCLYILCLTKVLGIDFKSAVLNFYYQMIK